MNCWARTTIAVTFRLDHAADLGANHFLDENGIVSKRPKLDFLLEMVKELLAQGVPIQGVGIQGHRVWRAHENNDSGCFRFAKEHPHSLAIPKSLGYSWLSLP
ncbi:MAG: hypothetical protein HOC20_12830 [Chloroflexi bacterium]|jgi:GH35 family endo-1,4-beta-xylanase|nr:hypothetical protein [Chloroflexota bacterium]